MNNSPFHFGRWLKREITNREMTVAAFAAEVGLSEARLWGLIKLPAPGIRDDSVVRIARGLRATREEIENKLREASTPHAAVA